MVRKPIFNKPCFYHIIGSNWHENRIGRSIHNREIPEDYELEKIKELECSYDWLKPKFELDLKYNIQKRLFDFLND